MAALAVLKIYYQHQGKLHAEPQGKFFYRDNKPVYLADMSPGKVWRNYNGYSIAKQLIDAFSKLKLRPDIIYRRQDLQILYHATISRFTRKGIFVPYGGHEQFVLPISQFDAVRGDIDDPKNLPIMRLSDWIRQMQIVPKQQSFFPSEPNDQKKFYMDWCTH